MRWLFLVLLGTMTLAKAEPVAAYQPLAYLAGACWKGTFPDGKQADEHCFSWMYGGKFLRDRHTVHGEVDPVYLGETSYFWNASA